jgi:hypothetical protein
MFIIRFLFYFLGSYKSVNICMECINMIDSKVECLIREKYINGRKKERNTMRTGICKGSICRKVVSRIDPSRSIERIYLFPARISHIFDDSFCIECANSRKNICEPTSGMPEEKKVYWFLCTISILWPFIYEFFYTGFISIASIIDTILSIEWEYRFSKIFIHIRSICEKTHDPYLFLWNMKHISYISAYWYMWNEYLTWFSEFSTKKEVLTSFIKKTIWKIVEKMRKSPNMRDWWYRCIVERKRRKTDSSENHIPYLFLSERNLVSKKCIRRKNNIWLIFHISVMGNKIHKFVILMSLMPEFSPKFRIPENMWILVHSCTSIDKDIHALILTKKMRNVERKNKKVFSFREKYVCFGMKNMGTPSSCFIYFKR